MPPCFLYWLFRTCPATLKTTGNARAWKPQREITAMFGVPTGKAVGVQRKNVIRGIQEYRKFARLITDRRLMIGV